MKPAPSRPPSLAVHSETGRLRSVLVHLPGAEIDRMVPSMMGELLFDDILFGEDSRAEHRRFQNLLRLVADEVLELADLLAEVLEDDAVRSLVLDDLEARLDLGEETRRRLRADSPAELTAHLVEGILRPGVTRMPEDPRQLYLLPPVPNLFFQRDPAVVIGDRVAVASMASAARLREPLIASYVFRFHPRFAGGAASPLLFHEFDPGVTRTHSLANPRPTFEGGDVLVVREDVLVIGISQRTRRATVEHLAAALRAARSGVRKLIVVDIPKARSYMHLDTVFTVLSRDECLIHEPAILPGGVEEVDVYQIDLGRREVSYTAKRSLLRALAETGIDLRPIPCGGAGDPIAQQREQWTDGANAFALAPGIVLCYERNLRTATELERAGYQVVHEDDLLLGRTQLEEKAGAGRRKYAIQMAANELSRARGGPRCMTMPLVREPL